MLTLDQVKDIEAREAVRVEFMKRAKRNYLTPEDQTQLPSVTNEERSAVEVYYWHNEPPEKYFLYVKEDSNTATTWTGEALGRVSFGREYRSCFGDKRQSVMLYGTNGRNYHGTYYKSAGDYARVKAFKQPTNKGE